MKSLIAGTEQLVTSTSFHDTVYNSFLETLIQGLSDFTSDIKEYLRLGRGLWPFYISPLIPENIESTITFVQQANVAKGKRCTNENNEDMERDLLPLLDQKFFPHLRHALEYGFGALRFDSTGTVTTTTKRNSSNAHADDLLRLSPMANRELTKGGGHRGESRPTRAAPAAVACHPGEPTQRPLMRTRLAS